MRRIVLVLGCGLATGCFSEPGETPDAAETEASSGSTTAAATGSTSSSGVTSTSNTSASTTTGTTDTTTTTATSTSSVTTDDPSATGSETSASTGSSGETMPMTTSTGTGSSSTGGDPLAECEALGFGFPSGQWSTGLPAEVCFGAEAAERDLVFRIDGEDYDMVEFMPDGGGACIAPYTWTLQMPPNIDAPAGAELSLGFYSGGGGVELAVCTVGIQ